MKPLIRDIVQIFIIASVLGLAVNAVNPRGVKIGFSRPPRTSAADSSLTGGSFKEPFLVNREQLRRMAESGAVIIDARSPEEFAAGHIPGAVNIHFEALHEYVDVMEALPRDRWVVCYCDGPPCDKGEMLARELVAQGFPRVAYYYDGLDDWKRAGLEVVR